MMIPVTWHFFNTFLSGKIPCCMHPMYSQYKHAPEKHFFSLRCWYVTLALPSHSTTWDFHSDMDSIEYAESKENVFGEDGAVEASRFQGQQDGGTATSNSNICEDTGVQIYNGEYTQQVGVSIVLSCVAFRPVWLS